MSLIVIFRAYFSSAHGTFSRIDNMLGHKSSLNKFRKIEILSSIFSDQNAMKQEISHKKNTEKHAKTWKLKNMLLNNDQVNNEVKKEIKRYIETNENEDTTFQNLWGTRKAILKWEFVALQTYLKT